SLVHRGQVSTVDLCTAKKHPKRCPMPRGQACQKRQRKEHAVTPIDAIHEQLRDATGLAGIMDATYRAFMAMRPVFEELQDRGGPGFAAFVLAGTQAANGRFWQAGPGKSRQSARG